MRVLTLILSTVALVACAKEQPAEPQVDPLPKVTPAVWTPLKLEAAPPLMPLLEKVTAPTATLRLPARPLDLWAEQGVVLATMEDGSVTLIEQRDGKVHTVALPRSLCLPNDMATDGRGNVCALMQC